MQLHHIGLAVKDIVEPREFYRAIGYVWRAGPVVDPAQQAEIVLLQPPDHTPLIELCRPLSSDSPIARMLARGLVSYHVCYEVQNVASALHDLREAGALILGEPVAAVAFGGRKIAWVWTRFGQLVEVLGA